MNRVIVVVFAVVGAVSGSRAEAAPQLGTVDFPTSCAAAAQPALNRALALLHSFQYDEASQAFDEASHWDGHCAMAHWGKAIALYHQLWDWPAPAAFKQANSELARAQRIGTKARREQLYIAAATAFFQDRPVATHGARVQAYSGALAVLHREFPQDHEATAFYALSLVALAGQHVDDLQNLRQAIVILQPLLVEFPDHPGMAHYLIHAADRPELTSLGLEAARKYADIAPDSAHALHMPAHIFVRLGLWQETIDVNLRSAAAGAHAAIEHHGSPGYQFHAMDFLEYAYLQRGEEAKARQIVGQVRDVAGAPADVAVGEAAYGQARTAIELHRWAEAAALPLPQLPLRDQSDTYRARAIGAARSGDAVAARENLVKLRESNRAGQQNGGDRAPAEMSVDQLEAEAWVAFAEGHGDDATAELRQAANRENKEGGDSVAVPAREMLADLFLELKRPLEALDSYKAVLASSPNRFDAVYGAAQAAAVAGDSAGSADYFRELLQIAAPDADRPEIAQAKAALGQ